MMENIKEEAKKYADKFWEEKLKKEFEDKINKSFIAILKELKIGINDYNSSIKSGIDILDKQFNDKWDKKFEDERSQLESLKNPNNSKNNNEENKLKDNKEDLINNNNNNNISGYNAKEIKIKTNTNNDHYEDDEKLRKKVIDLKNLKEPILNYLKLLKDTNPLINIILQCICNINEIIFYYLNPEKENKILKKSKENPNAIYLSPSFLKLLDHLWKSNQKEYEPLEIHDNLKVLMSDYNTEDPSMIINYLLTQLNDELNINNANNNNNNNNISQSDPFDDYNLEMVKKKFSESFSKNKTKISNTFYSSIKITKRCLKCQAEPLYFFEASPVINIYLVENKNDRYNKLSLEEHFHNLLNVEEEQNIKENCLICGSIQEKRQTKEVFTGSEVLIININREKDKDKTIYFKYPETFNGQKIINPEMPAMSNYNLTTVIKKAKDYSHNNYYYVAYYRNFIDECWYSFDNKKIESIPRNYEYYILDEKNAIVLIYTKIK